MTSQTNLSPITTTNPTKLLKKSICLILVAILVMGCSFFLPAGTFQFWEAWVYMAVLLTPMLGVMFNFIKKDPELLERRLTAKEKEVEQKLIQKLGAVFFLAIFLIPGFDQRYGWSQMPVTMVIIADAMILLAYILFFFVLKENSYASRVVTVEQKQKVVTTGLYAIVRHPMYVAILLIYFFTPLALGSYWATLPFFPILFIIIARIKNEEKVLIEQLEGYREYMNKTKYRLIPGAW
jgi:protein-S-isoprenylcysteine O-methyltransferase Ste14